MSAPSRLEANIVAQLLSRALGGAPALVAFDVSGKPVENLGAPSDAAYLAPGYVLEPVMREDLAAGRRTELEISGQRFVALGARAEDGLLWLAIRPVNEQLTLPRFAQHLVHALRNSLSGIKLAVQSLTKVESLAPRDRRRVTIAAREIARMERLISTASEFARAPSRGEELCDLRELLMAAVEATQPEREARQVALELTCAESVPVVRGDALRLRLTCENLLGFGARAMGEGGTLEVRLLVEGNAPRLEVRDHGPSLSAADRENLLLPLANAGRLPGLDLALASQVARETGGSLAVEDASPGVRLRLLFGAGGAG